MYQRNADPKSALDEVIFALESAGRSVVLPTDGSATLGKMVNALRDKPTKWTVPIGSVKRLAQRLADLWTRQPRHGVDDSNDVKEVPRELAEAAVHEAITLVHWFRAGLVARI